MLWGINSGYLANSVLLVLNSQVNLDIKDQLFSKSLTLSELINFDLKISNSSLCLPSSIICVHHLTVGVLLIILSGLIRIFRSLFNELTQVYVHP